MRAGEEPGCGACGYSTRGLTTLICPECGGDLRVVGITGKPQSGSRGIAGFIAGAFIVSLVVLSVAGAVASLLAPLVPTPRIYTRDVTLVPRSDPTRTYTASTRVEVYGDAPRRIDVAIERKPLAAGAVPLTFDAKTGSYRYGEPDGRVVDAPSGFGPEVVLSWMKSIGVKMPNPQVEIEAARLAGVARVIGHIPPPGAMALSGSSTSSGSAGPFSTTTMRYANTTLTPPAAKWLFVGGTLLAWYVLLMTLRRLRRIPG